MRCIAAALATAAFVATLPRSHQGLITLGLVWALYGLWELRGACRALCQVVSSVGILGGIALSLIVWLITGHALLSGGLLGGALGLCAAVVWRDRARIIRAVRAVRTPPGGHRRPAERSGD